MERPERSLTLVDCIALGVNGIIGSGIYLQLAPLAQQAGPASVLGVLGCGLLCSLIALCFVELSGMFDRSGGAYVYARAAFGPYVGFGVGWMCVASGVLGFATVAVGFAEQLLPASLPPVRLLGLEITARPLVAVGLISVLGGINYLGVKAGARTLDLLSLAKTLPLLALGLFGLLAVRGEVVEAILSPQAVPGGGGTARGYLAAVLTSAYLAVFMFSGFEYTAVPAGEVKDARRTIPIAIISSLLGATLLYCALMLVAHSVLPDLVQRQQPLPEAASALVGPWGGGVLRAAALVSMAGFCAGSALGGPRYLAALAEDGYLPASLAALTRFRTPGAAILLTSGAAALLALLLGYESLVDISIVALFAQYIPATLAVPILRLTRPEAPRAFRLPGGALIPVLATAISVGLLVFARPAAREWLLSLQVLALGAGVWALTAWSRRSRAAVKPAPPPR